MAQGTRDWSTTAIVETVAENEDIDPLELPPLYTVLDPDLLERVIESAREDVTIEFTYCGYDVALDGTGEVQITARTETTAAPNTREQ